MANNEGGEKSEEATPQQLRKAREEGNVAKSRELTAGVSLFIVAVFLFFYMPFMMSVAEELFTGFFEFSHFTITKQSIIEIFYLSLLAMAKMLVPLFIFLFVCVFLIEAAQVGFEFSSKAIEPKWERINFFVGLPKYLQMKKKLVELLKSVFKIVVLGYVGIAIIESHIETIMRSTVAEYPQSSIFAGKLLFEIIFKTALLVIVLGIFDLMYQIWQRKQDLKMSKQQVKEEFKQMEGDPLIKQRIREAQRELARKKMMNDVPQADVVVTNPIHYAVALKYEGGGAPVVVAKGQRLMALKIKEIAAENGVYIHEDPPLARALYKTVEIGEEIPENLYKAVAEILAIVYRAKGIKR